MFSIWIILLANRRVSFAISPGLSGTTTERASLSQNLTFLPDRVALAVASSSVTTFRIILLVGTSEEMPRMLTPFAARATP